MRHRCVLLRAFDIGCCQDGIGTLTHVLVALFGLIHRGRLPVFGGVLVRLFGFGSPEGGLGGGGEAPEENSPQVVGVLLFGGALGLLLGVIAGRRGAVLMGLLPLQLGGALALLLDAALGVLFRGLKVLHVILQRGRLPQITGVGSLISQLRGPGFFLFGPSLLLLPLCFLSSLNGGASRQLLALLL